MTTDEVHFSDDFRERFANHTVPELIELLIVQRAKIGSLEIRVAEAEEALEWWQQNQRNPLADELVRVAIRAALVIYDSYKNPSGSASADDWVRLGMALEPFRGWQEA